MPPPEIDIEATTLADSCTTALFDHLMEPVYCCGDKDCFPAACDQLVGTVYGWLYVPTGNLFDAEQGATA